MQAQIPAQVRVVEVGPRDGLQNEKGIIATDDKVTFIDLLSEAGFEMVEATSFVHPRAIPQLADAAEVLARIAKPAAVRFPVLVPNSRGMERAVEAGVKEIAVFTAASDTFNQRNINATIDESLVKRRDPPYLIAILVLAASDRTTLRLLGVAPAVEPAKP